MFEKPLIENMPSAALQFSGFSLEDLPKSNVFTSRLPVDAVFGTPEASHEASRDKLGPRLVHEGIFTYVRPESSESPEILGVSPNAMRDLGLKPSESRTTMFRELVAGNKIWWSKRTGGIYPWAQCYGGECFPGSAEEFYLIRQGWQFGIWAGQLGDGRVISLFETTHPQTNKRYEWQLKGAGKTPYSRFADGKATLRSSIREYVASEALDALGIRTTRALSITLLPKSQVRRERTQPGAIVARFAESWIRIGTFDLLHARRDHEGIRELADFVAEEIFGGWKTLASSAACFQDSSGMVNKQYCDIREAEIQEKFLQLRGDVKENRFARLFGEICRRNAQTVAAWQAYGFINGVLNTDNTSILGLSLDYGPFAFMDIFDPNYTPNHDDRLSRYSFRNQPAMIWWNLARLGESLSELIGAGNHVDDDYVLESETVNREAGKIIAIAKEEYETVLEVEYINLMSQRIGLRSAPKAESQALITELKDILEALELDYNRFFRELSSVPFSRLDTENGRMEAARIFAHKEGFTALGYTDEAARYRVSSWLAKWRTNVLQEWDTKCDSERQIFMKSVNPNVSLPRPLSAHDLPETITYSHQFLPRSWILDEVADRVQFEGDRQILQLVTQMSLHPFDDEWGTQAEEEHRYCGDTPLRRRNDLRSCSS